VGAELFHADEGTGMTNLIVAFRSLAVVPKKILNIKLNIEFIIGSFMGTVICWQIPVYFWPEVGLRNRT
jgi:ABC-type uncharacterized transport system permease subunit